MGRKPTDFEEQLLANAKYQKLIRALKTESLRRKDILLLLNMQNTNSCRERITRMLITIGNHYPLYEPIPAHFKILTDEDLKEYEELYRTQKQARENQRKWQTTK